VTPRYPLLYLSIAFVVGILLAAQVSLPVLAWLVLAAAALALLALPRLFALSPGLARFISRLPQRLTQLATRTNAFLHRHLPLPLPVLLAVICLGAARFQAAQPTYEPGFIAWYNDLKSTLIVEGTLVEPPDERDRYTNLRLEVDQLRLAYDLEFVPVHGLLLARLPAGGHWRYGDRVRLEGHIQTPPEFTEFSYREYLARQDIYSFTSDADAALLLHDQGNPLLAAIYSLRQRALELVYRLYPDPEASLLAGILLGVQTGIPQEVQQAFRDTGTSHVIAISGFNITIIAGMFTALFSRLLGERRGALAAALGIAFYTVLVGASAAVVRAALLGMLTLLGRQVGRRQVGLNSLAFVGAGMALFSPSVLWDIGFQLSFAATLGLMLYATPFSEAFKRFAGRFLPAAAVERLAGPVGAYVLFTLAAQLTTLPVTIYHFGSLSLTSLIANPVILPVQPAVMVLGGLSVLAGLLFQPAGQLVAYLAWPLVAFTIRVVEGFATLPGGVLQLGQMALPLVILFYLLLFGFTLGRLRFAPLQANFGPAAPLAALALVTALVWRSALSAPDGLLHVVVLNVGTGEAILVQTPGGRNLLINGGPSPSQLSEALGRRLPLADRRLDWLVIAAPHEEDVAALPSLLGRFPPQNVLWAGPTHAVYASRRLWETLRLADLPLNAMQPGQALDLGDGASLRALSVGSRGAVLLLEWQNFRLLLPCGQDFESLETYHQGQDIGPVTALLLADSGYAPLNPPAWLAALRPQVVLLSVAVSNPLGLPSAETLQALDGYSLLRTDQHGWIELTTDGQQLWVTVEKSP
jgi:competence protein ComEC